MRKYQSTDWNTGSNVYSKETQECYVRNRIGITRLGTGTENGTKLETEILRAYW